MYINTVASSNKTNPFSNEKVALLEEWALLRVKFSDGQQFHPYQ